jgi:hypothetical protein
LVSIPEGKRPLGNTGNTKVLKLVLNFGQGRDHLQNLGVDGRIVRL